MQRRSETSARTHVTSLCVIAVVEFGAVVMDER
jgi:hypothetical protein